MAKNTKATYIGVNVQPEVKRAIYRECARRNISVSDYVRLALERSLAS